MRGTKVAAGILAGGTSLLGVFALTSRLTADGGMSDEPLVVQGGVPRAGVAITASPDDRGHLDTGRADADDPPSSDYADWALDVEASTGIPSRALVAYAEVVERLAEDDADCHLSWPTLAGIGSVESGNGSAGGGLLASGRSLQGIYGVALDGVGAVARITDTDDGVLDRDPNLDRAIGPLQFLPSTWVSWSSDGDGDGVSDPQDIDDAALAAGRYLCASGDLATPEGWTAAVLSYNHSDDYLEAVYAASQDAATRS